jgi:hypothetical protein
LTKKGRIQKQIAFILRQAEEGTAVEEVCRKVGISIQTYHLYGLLPLRKRSSDWDPSASLRTCIRRLGFDPAPEWQIRLHGPQPLADLGVAAIKAGLSAGRSDLLLHSLEMPATLVARNCTGSRGR